MNQNCSVNSIRLINIVHVVLDERSGLTFQTKKFLTDNICFIKHCDISDKTQSLEIYTTADYQHYYVFIFMKSEIRSQKV